MMSIINIPAINTISIAYTNSETEIYIYIFKEKIVEGEVRKRKGKRSERD